MLDKSEQCAQDIAAADPRQQFFLGDGSDALVQYLSAATLLCRAAVDWFMCISESSCARNGGAHRCGPCRRRDRFQTRSLDAFDALVEDCVFKRASCLSAPASWKRCEATTALADALSLCILNAASAAAPGRRRVGQIKTFSQSLFVFKFILASF